MFRILLALSLALCIGGLFYRIGSWFKKSDWGESRSGFLKRLGAAARGAAATILSRKLATLARVFATQVLLQGKVFKQSFYRWLSHALILWGFLFLLLFHALGGRFAAPLWGADYAYQNPMLFLRDLAGLLVLVGLGMAVRRRAFTRQPRLKTAASDVILLALIAAIIASGFLLESVKMTSERVFTDMAVDWAGLDPEDDAGDIAALKAYWAEENGLALPGGYDPELAEAGREADEAYCRSCHVSNRWAPAGYLLARGMGGVSPALNGERGLAFFYWLHALLCLAALATLPFTKLFHVLSTPLSLLVNAVTDWERCRPENAATIRALGLDACVHCSGCNLNESMAVLHALSGNDCILPSEKLRMLKNAPDKISMHDKCALRTGLTFCTCCDKCTRVCPAGIELRQIWKITRQQLFRREELDFALLSPLAFHPSLSAGAGTDNMRELIGRTRQAVSDGCCRNREPLVLTKSSPRTALTEFLNGPSAARCLGCQSCTNACPVVTGGQKPIEELGMLPNQIMRAVGIGRADLALGAGMLWSCLGCYRCQEVCPGGVLVADILFELRNLSLERAGADYDERAGMAPLCPARLPVGCPAHNSLVCPGKE